MKNKVLITVFTMIIISTSILAQNRSDWGLGISLGDPTGFTAKYNVNNRSAWNFNIGSSYFGGIRVGADYLWHFDAFNSSVVAMHAGFGGVVGIGESNSVIYSNNKKVYYIEDGETGIGVRGMIGVDVYPKGTPLEIFLEMGPLLGLAPRTGSAFDVALGLRFYP